MNDVLPKPFTKEGLLTMLEKHLGHLKSGREGDAVPFGPPTMIGHRSGRPSIKDDSSSVRSPSIGNWQSPTQDPVISPKSHSITEEFTAGSGRAAAPFGHDPTASHHPFNFPSPPEGKVGGGGGGGGGGANVDSHRRKISRISDGSAGDDVMNDAKRSRI